MLPDHKKDFAFNFADINSYWVAHLLTNCLVHFRILHRDERDRTWRGGFSFSEILAQKMEIIFNTENFESDWVKNHQGGKISFQMRKCSTVILEKAILI